VSPWKELSPEEMAAFADEWLASLSEESEEDPVGQAVVLMGFTAPPDQQWDFVAAAVARAETDEHLAHIAAGPAECLLGRHGDASIAWFEERSAADPKFARMMTGVWRYRMTDEVWERVQRLQARVEDPLPD